MVERLILCTIRLEFRTIVWSVVTIGREFPFPIDLSPSRLREGISERQNTLDNFETASPLLFIQREVFTTLVSERILRHIDLRKKWNIMREFYTRYLVVVRKQLRSIRKYGKSHIIVLKKRDLTESMDSIWNKISVWLD